METMTKSQKKDIKLLGKFVEVYCNGKHYDAEQSPVDLPEELGVRTLCPDFIAVCDSPAAEMSAGIREADVQTVPYPLLCQTPTGQGKGDYGILGAHAYAAWQTGLPLALFFLARTDKMKVDKH